MQTLPGQARTGSFFAGLQALSAFLQSRHPFPPCCRGPGGPRNAPCDRQAGERPSLRELPATSSPFIRGRSLSLRCMLPFLRYPSNRRNRFPLPISIFRLPLSVKGFGEESLQACREGRIRWATWPARMAEGRGQGCACSAWQRRSGKQKTEPVLEEEKVRSRALTRRGINAARASGAQKHLPQSPLNAGRREKLFRNIHTTDRIGAYAVPRDAAGMHAPEQPIPSGLQIHAYQPMRLGKLLNRPTIRIHARASARRGQAP